MGIYIIAAVVMFGILIAVHEFGHFITAKLCGVTVHEFSIGMGPRLWHRQGRETEYSLRLLPIGGYCAIEGEEDDSDDPRSLNNQGFFRQLLVFAAGAGMNFLLGLLLVTLLYSGAQGFYTAEVVSLADGFPAESEEGVLVGDVIYAINGKRVYMMSDVQLILTYGGIDRTQPITLTLLREGEKHTCTLERRTYSGEDGESYQGYGFTYGGVEEVGFSGRLKYSWYTSLDFVRTVYYSLRMMVTGEVGVSDLSGPVGVVGTMAEVGQESENWMAAVENILYFAAMISVNLAVMNLLPIPALDGGKILFLAINAAALRLVGRKLPARVENSLATVFFLLLMALMAVVTVSDISKFLH